MGKIDKVDNNIENIEWIVLDGWGTIADILDKPLIPPLFWVNRDVRKYLMTHPVSLDEVKSKPLVVQWVEVNIPEFVINQTEAELRTAFLFPDFYSKVTHNGVEYEDTIEWLHANGKRVFLWSNWWEAYAKALDRLIKEGKLEYKFVSCYMKVQKPNPKFFKYIKEKTGIPFERMVMVWNSISSDIIWANAVWMQTVYMDRKHKGPPETMYIKTPWFYTTKIWTLDQLLDVLIKQ